MLPEDTPSGQIRIKYVDTTTKFRTLTLFRSKLKWNWFATQSRSSTFLQTPGLFGDRKYRDRLFFARLVPFNSIVAEVRYRIDGATPNRLLNCEDQFVKIPTTANSSAIRLTFVDGTEPDILTIQRKRNKRSASIEG